MKRFSQDHKSDKSLNEIEQILMKADHIGFIKSFIQYGILKTEAKRGTIWLHGAPNTGKTTLLKMLEEIFTIVPFT